MVSKPHLRNCVCVGSPLFTSKGEARSLVAKPARSVIARVLGKARTVIVCRAESRLFCRCYSYRSASIGCIREAFKAGKNPETIPTIARIVNEMIITPIDACRKIAPSWSVVL